MHKCLWDNKDKISKQCRAQEIKSQIMQSSNTELMPTLAKACKAERSAHCKGVRPGKSRVYNCLLTNSDSVDFSVACKEQLIAQQAKRVRDYRMDYDLRIGCKNDVPKVNSTSFFFQNQHFLKAGRLVQAVPCQINLLLGCFNAKVSDRLLLSGFPHKFVMDSQVPL